jgi:hypothetical protein
MRITVALIAGLALLTGPVAAHPWRDKVSTHEWRGQHGRDYERDYFERGDMLQNEKIPRGHLPPPGECMSDLGSRCSSRTPAAALSVLTACKSAVLAPPTPVMGQLSRPRRTRR